MKLMPLTTRPAATSRHGMMRLASPMGSRRLAAAELLALGRLQRRLEIEPAFVQRAAGDGTDNAVILEFEQLFDIVDRRNAAGSDDRNLQLAREPHCRLDVDAGEHAIAADIGVNHGLDPVILELAGQIDDIV